MDIYDTMSRFDGNGTDLFRRNKSRSLVGRSRTMKKMMKTKTKMKMKEMGRMRRPGVKKRRRKRRRRRLPAPRKSRATPTLKPRPSPIPKPISLRMRKTRHLMATQRRRILLIPTEPMFIKTRILTATQVSAPKMQPRRARKAMARRAKCYSRQPAFQRAQLKGQATAERIASIKLSLLDTQLIYARRTRLRRNLGSSCSLCIHIE